MNTGEYVLKKYCELLKVDKELLLSHRRETKLVNARKLISVRLREDGWSFPQIAKLLNRHHTSIMYYTGDIVKST